MMKSLTDKQKKYLKDKYEEAIDYYLDEGKSDSVAQKRAYKDVYIIDREAILSEVK